uniref:Uncharacterized protein n=1 Tax=Anguilla anguilla TaxID=7936 RepID=A0A0E9UE27_ANGAN
MAREYRSQDFLGISILNPLSQTQFHRREKKTAF